MAGDVGLGVFFARTRKLLTLTLLLSLVPLSIRRASAHSHPLIFDIEQGMPLSEQVPSRAAPIVGA